MKEIIYTLYRSPLKLEDGDTDYLHRIAGISRWVYNWALEQQEQRLADGLPTYTKNDLNLLNTRLREEELDKPGQEWLKLAPTGVHCCAIKCLLNAYSLYNNQHNQITTKGYVRNKPQRKKRSRAKLSFHLKSPRIRITTTASGKRYYTITDSNGHLYQLRKPNLTPEYLDHPYEATIKEEDGKWFITLHFCEPKLPLNPKGKPVGVDMGFKQMAVDSNANCYDQRDLSRGQYQRLCRLYKTQKNTQRGSRSYKRLQEKIDLLNYKRRCIQRDVHHKASASILETNKPLSERPSRIVVDHLNLTEIAKASEGLQSSVLHDNLYQLHLKLKAKAERQGTVFQVAHQHYPSSKLCNICGFKKSNLKLTDRTFKCPCCEGTIDRDLNAALNLADYPLHRQWGEVIKEKTTRHQERLILDQELDNPLGQGDYDWDDFAQ